MASSMATGWTPNLISSIFLDLNPQLQTGNDGDAVSLVSNQAPNKILQDYAWSQPTGANQPILKRNSMNGQSVFRFDGAASYLLSHSGTFSVNTAGFTYFIVHKLNNIAGGTFSMFLDELNTFHWNGPVVAGAGYQAYSFISKSPPVTAVNCVGIANALDTTNPHIFMRTYNGGTNSSTASYTAAYDGITQTVVASGLFGTVASTRDSIGASVSPTGVPSAFCSFDMARLLVFKAVLSTGDILNVTRYLRGLYGI